MIIDVIIAVSVGGAIIFTFGVFKLCKYICCCWRKNKNQRLLDEHMPIINNDFQSSEQKFTDI